jgi:hypothetical protein
VAGLPELLIELLGLEAPKKEVKAKKGKGSKRAAGKKGKEKAKAKVWDPGQITDGSIPLDDHTKVREQRSAGAMAFTSLCGSPSCARVQPAPRCHALLALRV